MNFSQAIQHVFQNYANFNGRARRSEYWYFALLNGIVYVFYFTPLAPVSAIYSLAVLVPTVAVCVRRLHDTGRGGAYLLLLLVPLVGEILLLIWFAQDSAPGPNRFGPNPKGAAALPDQSRAPARTALAVRCLAGPLQGQVYPLGSQELLFGRAPNCTVRMPDRTPGLSNIHCLLRYSQGGMPELVDLGSSYGTYTGAGKRLPPHYPEPVAAGTRFWLGSQNLLFQIVVQ